MQSGDGAIDALGRKLAEADRDNSLIAATALIEAGLLPTSLDAAMRAQAAGVAALGRPVIGWKVGVAPGGTPAAAPMMAIEPATPADGSAWRLPGLAALEVEIAVLLKADLPPRPGAPYQRDEILNCVGSVHLGMELIVHRLQEGSMADFALFLADRLGNGGYLLGPELDREILNTFAQAMLPTLHVRVDGEVLFAGAGRHGNDDLLVPLVAYANAQNDQLGGLRSGQIVTTGALCGVVPARAPCRVEIDWMQRFAANIVR